MGFETTKATSGQLWLSALVFLVLDLVLVWFLTKRVDRERFRALKWHLVLAAVLFWSVVAVFLVQSFWESYYDHFYPGWIQGGGILVYVPVVYGLCALAFHWLSLCIRGNPIVNFMLLCGIESVLEHLWGIVRMHILEIPMLQEAGTVDILVVAVPEYVFYWCLVIGFALLLHKAWKRVQSPKQA